MTDFRRKLGNLVQTDFVFFCCIGAVNTIIHASIVISMVEFLGIGSTVSNTLAFFGANMFSYVANSLLTFKAPLSAERYVRFLGSSLIVLATTIIMAAIGEILGIHYIAVMICLILTSPILSFVLVKRFAFGKRA